MNMVKRTLLIVTCMLFASMPLKAEWTFTKVVTLAVLVSTATAYGAQKVYDIVSKKLNRRKPATAPVVAELEAQSVNSEEAEAKPAYEIDPKYQAIDEGDLAGTNASATDFMKNRALGFYDKYSLFAE